jgi:uncharacterized protein (DUF885 family)
MPVDQMNGVHTGLADLPLSMPFDSVKHYEDYISRLHQILRVLSETTEVLRTGLKDNLMPVRFLLEKVPVQCNGIIEANPFLIPTKKFPASISPEDQKRLTAEITAAVNIDVLPAYRTFATSRPMRKIHKLTPHRSQKWLFRQAPRGPIQRPNQLPSLICVFVYGWVVEDR